MENLYMKYIAVDGLTKAIEKAGSEISSVGISEWGSKYDSSFDAKGSLPQVTCFARSFHSGDQEHVERVAVSLLDSLRGAKLRRDDGTIRVYGRMHGITVMVTVGTGLCERVQTGTRKVLKPAPDAPMIEVEEPVMEWRCKDDINEALAVAS